MLMLTTEASQNVTSGALVALFASRARASVLKLFLLDPTRAYYQRQIESATGLAIRGVQRELERLTSMGLLYRRSEGNRAYYQVDMQFPIFPELRSMVLKACDLTERLRGNLAMDEAVRLAFLHEPTSGVLVVSAPGKRPTVVARESFQVEILTSDEFAQAVSMRSSALEPFLTDGVDLLGRRDDVIWRRIESAGYVVQKGKGVA